MKCSSLDERPIKVAQLNTNPESMSTQNKRDVFIFEHKSETAKDLLFIGTPMND
jgi:hypothetical protein